MDNIKNNKINRILGMYSRLTNGELINKAEEALKYGVNERSIQRDIDDIRGYLDDAVAESGYVNTILYERCEKGYRLEQIYGTKLTNSEILALCKILLDSRAFTKTEMTRVLNKLIECCVPKSNQKLVTDLISNEAFHYIEPKHNTVFLDTLWKVGQAIHNCQYIDISYQRTKDKVIVNRIVKPVAIIFSEYYFYLTAFIEDKDVRKNFDVINDAFPTIYRVDRIRDIQVLDKKFHIPYSSRFEEGEFRKRVQFMYGGKLQKVRFRYTGPDVDAVLDRLPTAQILSEEDGAYVISAEVFGKGIDMWLRSQGDYVEKL